MISMQYLKSRIFRFKLQTLFTYNDGNFGKSGRLVRVAEIAPILLTVGRRTEIVSIFLASLK